VPLSEIKSHRNHQKDNEKALPPRKRNLLPLLVHHRERHEPNNEWRNDEDEPDKGVPRQITKMDFYKSRNAQTQQSRHIVSDDGLEVLF